MKKTLTLLGALCAMSLVVGCSSDDTEVTPPPTGGGTGGGGPGGTGGGPGGDGDGDGDGDVTVSPLFSGTGSWVDGTENPVGVQGAFFVLEDSVENGEPVSDGLTHSDLTPDTFDEDTVKPCVSGTIAAVTGADGGMCDPAGAGVACEWSAIWGGGIGLNLNETGGEASVKSAWDATAAGVSGFAFRLSGTYGHTIRFKAKMEGSESDFCTPVVTGVEQQIALTDLVHNCYQGGVASETLDVTKLVQLEWQLVADANTSFTAADFCVESVGYF